VIEGVVIVVALLSGAQAWWQRRRQRLAGVEPESQKTFWDYFTRNGIILAVVGLVGFTIYAAAFGVGSGPTGPITTTTP
jgi:uncharacterized iron-regulated membrane protein